MWNSLSVNTRSADSFASFKRGLKSELCIYLRHLGRFIAITALEFVFCATDRAI